MGSQSKPMTRFRNEVNCDSKRNHHQNQGNRPFACRAAQVTQLGADPSCPSGAGGLPRSRPPASAAPPGSDARSARVPGAPRESAAARRFPRYAGESRRSPRSGPRSREPDAMDRADATRSTHWGRDPAAGTSCAPGGRPGDRSRTGAPLRDRPALPTYRTVPVPLLLRSVFFLRPTVAGCATIRYPFGGGLAYTRSRPGMTRWVPTCRRLGSTVGLAARSSSRESR